MVREVFGLGRDVDESLSVDEAVWERGNFWFGMDGVAGGVEVAV